MEADTDPQIVPNSLDPASDSSDPALPVPDTCLSSVPATCPPNLSHPRLLGSVEEINAPQNCTFKLYVSSLSCGNSSSGGTSNTKKVNSSSDEGDVQILEPATCPPLAMCCSPVSFPQSQMLHASAEKINAGQNGSVKEHESNSSCGNPSSGKSCNSKEVDLRFQDRDMPTAVDATCPTEPTAKCPSPVSLCRSPRLARSLEESNAAQNCIAEQSASMLSCRNLSSQGWLEE